MSDLRPGVRRVLRASSGDERTVRGEVDEEVKLHIELRAAELVESGLSESEALAEARRLFSREDDAVRALYGLALERNRRMRMRERWESLVQDVRYAARGLRRDRLLTLFVVAALTLGIGANVTSFVLLDRLLLRDPAHVADPGSLLRLFGTVEMRGEARTSSWIPFVAYEILRDNLTTLERVSAYRVTPQIVGRGESARRLRVGQTRDDFFGTLGTIALRGRLYGADTDGGPDVVVISERLWREDLARTPDVIGQSLVVDDVVRTIVGVAPAGFAGTELRRVDAWVPASRAQARTTNWQILGRVRAGASPEAVGAEATRIHEQLYDPPAQRWFMGAALHAGSTRLNDFGEERFEATMARWLALISLVILLIATGNVINLLLARSARRGSELAVRIALGCGRARVARLIALEGVLLATAAGLLSTVVVLVGEPVVRSALVVDAPWTTSLLDVRLLALLLGAVTLTAAVIGIAPTLHAGSTRLTSLLRSDRTSGPGGGRTRALLTVFQASLSVALLVGAGLFLRSVDRVHGLDLGVDPDQVLVVRPEIFGAAERYSQNRELDVLGRIADAVRTRPGVARVAVSVGLPLDGGSFSAALYLPGSDSIPSSPTGPFVSAVGPDYFETIGTEVLRGRAFDTRDIATSEPVVIVNERMARTLWPATEAVGKCVRVDGADRPCARVVGVVADVHRMGLREQPSMQYYLPLEQQTMFGGGAVVIRPTGRAPITAVALRSVVMEAEPSIRLIEISTLGEALDGEMRPLRLGMIAFGLSAVLALIVAVLGLYSVMAYMVAWRTREIGVRIALGATRAQITSLVILSGGRLAVVGVASGLLLARMGGRWLEPHLFETSASDPVVLGTVAATLVFVAALAGWFPARRASGIDPTHALKS